MMHHAKSALNAVLLYVRTLCKQKNTLQVQYNIYNAVGYYM